MQSLNDVKMPPPTGTQPSAQAANSCDRRIVLGLGRRGRFLVLVASVAILVWYHSFFLHIPGAELPSTAPIPSQDKQEFDWFALTPSRDIEWTPCFEGEKCARLLLPLDHDIPDGPTTAIALRMIPATDLENYRGPILMNPGGPGGSGTYFIGAAGRSLSRIVGPSFDILGFDPRGTGQSTPAALCFDSDSQRSIWNTQEGHQLLNASEGALEPFHSRAKLLAQRCEDRIGGEWGIGKFVNTPNVANDMLAINKKLGYEKLQYWGFSYGSVLGQYFSAMHPDKIERLVIDGVYDAEDYRLGNWGTNIVDIDRVSDALFTFCHQAGPEKCSIYEPTPELIRDRYLRVLAAVSRSPVPVPRAEPPTVITRKALLTQVFTATYKPLSAYPVLARTIHALETANQTALAALAPQITPPVECKCDAPRSGPLRSDNEATFSIACGDAEARAWDEAAFRAYYAALEDASPLMAPSWAYLPMQCREWTIRPNARWTRPFEARNTSHPILLVSARYDPVTPLADARVVQTRYGAAGLLVQESYGHCSISTPSLCTARYVREYFVNGTLPNEGATCESDELPFVGSALGEMHTLSRENTELLDALRAVAAAMPVSNFL